MKFKKIVYFIPFIGGLSFYTFISILGEFSRIDSLAWVCVSLLALAGILLSKGKWHGSFFGFIVGFLLMYSSLSNKGQIFNEFWLGAFLCVYYIVCIILQRNKF